MGNEPRHYMLKKNTDDFHQMFHYNNCFLLFTKYMFVYTRRSCGCWNCWIQDASILSIW